MNLRKRTIGSFSLIIIFILTIALIGSLSISNVTNYAEYSLEFKNLLIDLQQAKKHEKDFIEFDTKSDLILKGDSSSKNLNRIKLIANSSTKKLDSLRKESTTIIFGIEKRLEEIKYSFINYTEILDSLERLYKLRGFTNSGFEGQLRQVIHEVEKEYEPKLVDNIKGYDRGYLLMLRRREKDFFLRKDLKYLNKFNKDVDKYKSYLLSIKDSFNSNENNDELSSHINQMLPKIEEYKQIFTNNVRVNESIGLDAQSGLNFSLETTFKKLANGIEELSEEVSELSSQKHSLWVKSFWISTIVLVITVLLLTFNFLQFLLVPLRKIQLALTKLSFGNDGVSKNEISTTKSGNELEEVAINLVDLKERIDCAAEFSRQIGSGNLDIEYNSKFSNGSLAKAVIEMREKLRESANKERIRSWHTQGVAKFGQILQSEKDDLIVLSRVLVSHLCEYFDANQAAVFVVNDENPKEQFLELTGAYAYDRSKFLEMKVKPGQGLVGQCWLEKQIIFMTDIPKGYMNISSGLGDSSPSSIVILPLINNEEILGVVEMASFNVFKEHEIKLLEDLSKNIASTLSSVKVSSRTKLLLEESKMMQENLQAQEEEMRQNMEEMQATQDMMSQKESDYIDKINDLEKRLGSAM